MVFAGELGRQNAASQQKLRATRQRLRAQLYGLGYPRQPSPRATLAEVTLSLFLSKIQPAVYIRITNSSRVARELGWTSCLTSAGRVNRTTFLHINALARLTGTALNPDSNRGDRGMDSKWSFFKKPACLFQLDRVSKTYSCPFIEFSGNLHFRSSSQSRQIL